MGVYHVVDRHRPLKTIILGWIVVDFPWKFCCLFPESHHHIFDGKITICSFICMILYNHFLGAAVRLRLIFFYRYIKYYK